MRVTIIPVDNNVYVDGRALAVDCSSIPAEIHAVQWDGVRGEVEYKTIGGERKPNLAITSFDDFQHMVDLWNTEAAKPPVVQAASIPKSVTATTTKSDKPVNVIAN